MKAPINECFFCNKKIRHYEFIRICFHCKLVSSKKKLFEEILMLMGRYNPNTKNLKKKYRDKFPNACEHIKKGILTVSKREFEFMSERIKEKKRKKIKLDKNDRFFLSRVEPSKELEKDQPIIPEKWSIESINSVGNWLQDIGLNVLSVQRYKKIFQGDFKKILEEEYSEDKKIQFPEMIRRNHNREKLRKIGIKIEEHENLIWKVIHKKFPYYLENEGLKEQAFSSGIEGLMSAAGTFNPDVAKWSTYAWGWIEGKIKRHFQNNNPKSLIRIPCNKQGKEFKEMNASLETSSLDKKITESEDRGESLSCFIGNEEEMKRELFLNELKKHLIELYGEKKTLNFFSHVFHGKKWSFGKNDLEEMLDEVKYSFLQNGEFF